MRIWQRRIGSRTVGELLFTYWWAVPVGIIASVLAIVIL